MKGWYSIAEKIIDVGVDNCCISEVSIAELLYGIEKNLSPDRIRNRVQETISMFSQIPISDSLENYAAQ